MSLTSNQTISVEKINSSRINEVDFKKAKAYYAAFQATDEGENYGKVINGFL